MQAGHRPAGTSFLKIVSVQTSVCVFVCVCLPPRLLITSGMMWHDMTPYNWLKAFIWQLQSLSVVGVALELKHVMVTNLIKVSQHYISCLFTVTVIKNSCT